jgi:hypothetical protein
MKIEIKLKELSTCKPWELNEDEFYYDISKDDLDSLIKDLKKEKLSKITTMLSELLKCENPRCEDGNFPLGMDENDDVIWGGCPNCVVGSSYLPRVNPFKLKELVKKICL